MKRLNLTCLWNRSKVVIALVVLGSTSQASDSLDSQIAAAFVKSSQGFSADEVIIRDDLREAFLAELAENGREVQSPSDERDYLLSLLRLRKTGKLTSRSTMRGESIDASVYPISEIAARVVMDRHRISTDAILADPVMRTELQQEAVKIAPHADAYTIRKAVLGLRKRRALKPELVLKVADWGRVIQTHSLSDLKSKLEQDAVSAGPGIYLFRVPSGYLYIGEAKNLAERLTTHLSESDRASLAAYLSGDKAEEVTVELHVFSTNSPAMKVTQRRAYESELIRSRQPKFNVRP